VLAHTALFGAATWISVRAWPVASPAGAAVGVAADPAEVPAEAEEPIATLDALPALPAPAPIPVPDPSDPPPPDDSLDVPAPPPAPRTAESLAPAPSGRDWDAMAKPVRRRAPRIEVAGPQAPDAATVPPVPVYQPAPSRPAGMAGRSGVVLLRLLVGADGGVAEVRVHASSGHPPLDAAAARAAAGWRFRPATQAGAAVAAWVEVPVRF
jgi:protein TonB